MAWKLIQHYRTAFSTNNSNFRRKELWRLGVFGGAWQGKWELPKTCPGCSLLDP